MTEDRTRMAEGNEEHFVALHSGFRLGKYELQAVLGQGGFGITYKAWDGALNRAVAIKEYLPSDVAVRVDGSTVRARSRNDQESFQWGLERFLEEARALARFEATPSIVRVYDYMQENGTAYMVMALIEGTPLSAVYRSEAPLSEERLKAIVLPILDGLDDVHEAGFLHRDIKPANILIRPNGAPVLIDFGAARQALGEKSRSITSVFTPGYAPFEQYTSSGKQGAWTDIYALAATLYHGVTGKAPPQATDRIREDPMEPAVRVGAGRYSPQFLAAIDRGLEVFENRRPPNVTQWRDMLSGATPLAVPQSQGSAAPQQPAAGYAPHSQPGHTAAPTLGERGAPSQAPNSQGPVSQGPIGQGTISQAPAGQAPFSQTPPRKSRLPLIAAALALVLAGGGAAAFFALSPSAEPAVEETVQQRAQRLADEARHAADQARLAQDAAEAEMKKRAEQEAQQKAAEETRRRADADLARQAEQAKQEAERAQRESDGEARRKADEEVRKIAEAEAARRLESEKLEQERRALEAARAKAEAELAEARRQAEEARLQAEALRAQAEKSRAAAAEADARRKADEEARKKAEAEAKAKADAEAKAKAEAEAKAKAEAARKKAEDDAKARAEAAARARAEEEARRAQAARAPARTPAPVAAPPPPVSSAELRAAPSNQQAAVAPATPGFAYAGTWRLVIDCPNTPIAPFTDYTISAAGPNVTQNFYRDGKGQGSFAGDRFNYRFGFTGRGGSFLRGNLSLAARGSTRFVGGGLVNGFGQGAAERHCTAEMTKL